MEYYNNILCVTIDELTLDDVGEAVITLANYKYHVKKGKINVVRQGKGLGCYALIEYSSLPERFKVRFVEKYGDPVKVLKKEREMASLIIDFGARRYFGEECELKDGKHLPVEKVDEYALNASVLNELSKELLQMNTMRRSMGGGVKDVWGLMVKRSEELRDSYGHTLPENGSRLRERFNQYRKEGYSALVSKKFSNKSAQKLTDEAGDYVIALKRCRVPIRDSEQIFVEYNRTAAERGCEELRSVKTIVNFLNRPDIEPKWWDAVHGELASHQRYARKHRTEMPKLRDALWYSDGTKLNLFYKDFDADGRLVVKTTSVYEVMDAYSEAFLGYHISDHENFDAQRRAFRMAIERAGHRPYEIVNDNQGGHKKGDSTGFFNKIKGHISRRTAAYSPQSKSIEAAFGRFQAKVLSQDWRYTGGNITSGIRANLETVAPNKEGLFTLEELKVEYARMREVWNSMPHPHTGRPRIEMYMSSVNSECAKVAKYDIVDMFWNTTETPVTYTAMGITIQVDNKKYSYEVCEADGLPSQEFYDKHTFATFFVKYDLDDMTEVRLYAPDGDSMRYVATAKPYRVIHRAMQEQDESDIAFIRTMGDRDREQRIVKGIEAAELETRFGVALEQLGLNRPKIKGVSNKRAERIADEIVDRECVHEIDIGLQNKILSNITQNQISRYNKI